MRRYIPVLLVALLAACASPPVADGDFYTVRRGDTLIALGRAFGYSHHELATWNRLSDEDEIHVGQVLRVKPPPAARTRPAESAAVRKAPDRKPAAAEPKKEAPPPAPSSAEAERLNWMWPAQGKLSATTDRNQKGIDISGTTGQPVWAAEAGKVTYAGRGIRGYGNMIIVKHSRTLLSVYAHNKSIMVKEGQTVNRGQQIAEMGDTDSRTVKLYFEIRSNGKPINPVPLLPKPRS
ncbi:peptidoglycan DD-metalloendopeptidase family protein [Herbaspirillum sp. RV1423]|uniref:LysM peptidoglycan-binding domain-containing M23 family metallopeptidase n=1 Tax=Herbaspirillum sp. RV1423 TaxID=1443993 RepID=UPI0004B3B31E|nr:peptidoglycan DD-metalloendopeptidase family protein [Herbaspirillum sp. RV1423]